MEYDCKTHGIWDSNKASGCPECVREMRKEIEELSLLLRNIYVHYNQTSDISPDNLAEIGFLLGKKSV